MFPKSDHCDGTKFFNPWGVHIKKTLGELIRWKKDGTPKPWPSGYVKNLGIPQISPPSDQSLLITYIGHATLLLQSKDETVITDPQFSRRASPTQLAGPSRSRLPGLSIEELPKIDKVLISHNHYDHMDLPSLKSLQKAFNPLFIMPLGNSKYLKKAGISPTIELDWWQKLENITLVPAQHWSQRGLRDRNEALWGGFVCELSNKKVFFAGDTGYGPHFNYIFNNLGPMDVSLLPIGAYEPRWFMKDQHMNPSDAVKAHLDLKSKQSIAMHFETFRLTDEGFFDPRTTLKQELLSASINLPSFYIPETGATLQVEA